MSLSAQDFDFALPDSLIARYPAEHRSGSRLLCVDRETKTLSDELFPQFLDHLNERDLLIFNNTKVIPARLYGTKRSGGKIECLVERILKPKQALVHLRASKSPKEGSSLIFADGVEALVVGRKENLFILEFSGLLTLLDYLEKNGEVPLPPYLDRKAEMSDKERYQTVYARHEGAVAAPTAGLHFDEEIMQKLLQKNIAIEYVTLHVGAGTFQPVKVENVEQHVMHSEMMEVSTSVCEAIKACKQRGGRVIAIGTTVVRALETAAAKTNLLEPYHGETSIFIYPGFTFKVVDALLTNFHLPQSTLLMLVSAFAGKEFMRQAYEHAVAQKYRFFSYGDAMLIV